LCIKIQQYKLMFKEKLFQARTLLWHYNEMDHMTGINIVSVLVKSRGHEFEQTHIIVVGLRREPRDHVIYQI